MPILDYVVNNPVNVIVGVFVASLVTVAVNLVAFYYQRRSLPPGPVPHPRNGNNDLLRPKGLFPTLHELAKVDGKIYTFYFGTRPNVIVTDPTIGLEVLKRDHFAGRTQPRHMDIIFGGGVDIVSSDFNREWEVLRKVAHSAIRKFSVGDRLSEIVAVIVDDVLSEIEVKESNE